MEGVFCHFQIIEDEAGLAVESAHGRGDAVGFGAYDADGEASQSGGVLGAVAGSDAAAVLLPAAVEDVMDGLDGPVPAVQREQALGAGGVGGMAGDAVGVLDGLLASGFGGDGTLDEEGLADMGEGEVIVECRGGPDGAAFDASVGEVELLAEVGFGAFSEVEFEVGQQVGPIALDGEQVMRASADEEVGELCLGEQGVGGEGFAGEVGFEGLKHGDDGADLVGALGLFAGADGQAAYFFWVWVVWERWPTALGMWVWQGPSWSSWMALHRVLPSMARTSSSAPWASFQRCRARSSWGGVDAHQHVADDGLAGHGVEPVVAPAAEAFAGALGQVVGPLGHGLVAAHAAQGGGGGDAEHGGQGMAPPLAAAGIVDVGEEQRPGRAWCRRQA